MEITHIEAKEKCSCIAPPKFSFPFLPYANRASMVGFPREYLLLRSDIPESLLELSTDKIMKNLRICAACNGRFWHRIAKMKQAAEMTVGRPQEDEAEEAVKVEVEVGGDGRSGAQDQFSVGPIRAGPVRPVPVRRHPFQRIEPAPVPVPFLYHYAQPCPYPRPSSPPRVVPFSSPPSSIAGMRRTSSWMNGHTLSSGSLGSDESKEVIIPQTTCQIQKQKQDPTSFEDWRIASRNKHHDHECCAKKVLSGPWTHWHQWTDERDRSHPSSIPLIHHLGVTWDGPYCPIDHRLPSSQHQHQQRTVATNHQF